MSVAHKIKPGDAVSAAEVTANFSSLTTINQVGRLQIEAGSIDTRHISSTPDDWKEITVLTNPGTYPGAAGVVVLIGGGPPVPVHNTGMVLIVVKAQYKGLPGGLTDCRLRLSVGATNVRTAAIALGPSEDLAFSTVYAFTAFAATHAISLDILGTAAPNFQIIDPEIHVYAVRG